MLGGDWAGARPSKLWPRVAVFAFAVRLLYWVLLTRAWKPVSDAAQYIVIARNLAHGHGFAATFPQIFLHPTAFRPPLYPALLAPLMWIGGNALWPARLLNALIGTGVVVLAGVYAESIGGRRSGVVTACLVACYPPLVANDTVTLTEPLALALLLIALLAANRRRWALSALACGLFMLTRPNGYLLALIIAVYLVVAIGWRRALWFVLVICVVIAPWAIRNEIQVGTWQLTTSDGFTMAAMYAPPAQAAGQFVDPVYAPQFDTLDGRLLRLDEAKWDRELTSLAIHSALDHPGYVWRTVRRNFRTYFELSPSLNKKAESFDGRRLLVRTLSLPLFYVVTIAGLVGLWRFRRDRRVLLLAAVTAQFVILCLLLVAPPRLRAPFDLACCIGVGLLACRNTPETQPIVELAEATI